MFAFNLEPNTYVDDLSNLTSFVMRHILCLKIEI